MSEDFCKMIDDALGEESKGKKFYLDVVDKANKLELDPKTKALMEEILSSLSQAEAGHYETLKKIKDEFCPMK
jgi:hypothetical protein